MSSEIYYICLGNSMDVDNASVCIDFPTFKAMVATCHFSSALATKLMKGSGENCG